MMYVITSGTAQQSVSAAAVAATVSAKVAATIARTQRSSW